MKYFVDIDGKEIEVDVEGTSTGDYRARVSGSTTETHVRVAARSAKDITLMLEDRVLDWVLSGALEKVDVAGGGTRRTLGVQSARSRARAALSETGKKASDGTVTSPMPGKVVKVLVSVGDEVAEDAPLVVVEAMKMENELLSPRAGSVQEVFVAPGDAVEGGARLVTVS